MTRRIMRDNSPNHLGRLTESFGVTQQIIRDDSPNYSGRLTESFGTNH